MAVINEFDKLIADADMYSHVDYTFEATEQLIAKLKKALIEREEALKLSVQFFDDVLPQVGDLCLQDYVALNELAISFTKLDTRGSK